MLSIVNVDAFRFTSLSKGKDVASMFVLVGGNFIKLKKGYKI